MRIRDLYEAYKIITEYGHEVFNFGAYAWDATRARELIGQGKVKYETTTLNTKDWAEGILAMDNTKPWEKQGRSFFVGINMDHAQTLSGERLDRPVIAIDDEKLGGLMIIDGNHTIAKRYMDGLDTVEAYVIDGKEAKKKKITLQ